MAAIVLTAVVASSAAADGPAAGPGPAVAPQAVSSAPSIPRLDQCRIVYVYAPRSKVLQAAGRMWAVYQQPVLHTDTVAWLARRPKTEFDLADLLPPRRPGTRPLGQWWFEGVDATGTSWFLSEQDNKSCLTWTAEGKRQDRDLDGHYGAAAIGGAPEPNWPAIGKNVLAAKDGAVLVMQSGSVLHRRGDKWSSTPIPQVPDAWEPGGILGGEKINSPYWHQRIFADGEGAWIIRSATSNCRTAGSFVMHYDGASVEVLGRSKNSYYTAVVRHAGDTYILEADRKDNEGKETITPMRTWVLPRAKAPEEKEAALVPKLIADLDSDAWRVRAKASEELQRLAARHQETLRKALAVAVSAEQKMRLEQILAGLREGQRLNEATFAGHKAAALLFVARDGRQYVQPWKDGSPLPTLLVTAGGEKLIEVPLPGANIRIDLEGSQGEVYCSDGELLYRIDDRAGRVMPVLSLGPFIATTRLVGASGSKLCFHKELKLDWDDANVTFWVDLAQPTDLKPLPGRVIADGLGRVEDGAQHFPVAAGDGGLWFLKGQPGTVADWELWRSQGGQVRRVSDTVCAGDKSSVWRVGRELTIIIGDDSRFDRAGVRYICDGKETRSYGSLKELVATEKELLLKTLPDGAAYLAGDYDYRRFLVRAGGSVFVRDAAVSGNNGEIVSAVSIFRNGELARDSQGKIQAEGAEPPAELFERLAGWDPKTGRVLAFAKGCAVLQWLAPVAADDRIELQRPESFAWHWLDSTNFPRMGGTWILTEEGVGRYEKAHEAIKPQATAEGLMESEIQYQSKDIAPVRTWRNGRWIQRRFSLYDGGIAEDAAGSLWQFRMGELAVHLNAACEASAEAVRTQTFPMGDLHPWYRRRLAVESADAVWIATPTQLRRFTLARDSAGRPAEWKPDRSYGTAHLGFDWAGPWIVGEDVYYVSCGKLYHVSLKELLDPDRRSFSETSGRQQR